MTQTPPREPTAPIETATEITAGAPLIYGPARVRPEWIDHNGHMNVAYYVMAFDEALDDAHERIGLGADYRARTRHSTMTLEHHVNFIRETLEGEPFVIDLIVLNADAKRFHYFQTMRHAESGDVLATIEGMLIHVSLDARRSAPFPPELAAMLKALADAHAALERPVQVGRFVGAPVKPGHKP